jgi:hypothetical protein
VVVTFVRVLIEAHVVENEELRFGAEVGSIGESRVLQMRLGLARDPARIAIVVLARNRVDHVAGHHHRFGFVERIQVHRVGIRDQEHVALIDRRPAADARSVDAEARLERLFVQLRDRVGNVLLQSGQIGEAQIQLLHAFLLCNLEDVFGGFPCCAHHYIIATERLWARSKIWISTIGFCNTEHHY